MAWLQAAADHKQREQPRSEAGDGGSEGQLASAGFACFVTKKKEGKKKSKIPENEQRHCRQPRHADCRMHPDTKREKKAKHRCIRGHARCGWPVSPQPACMDSRERPAIRHPRMHLDTMRFVSWDRQQQLTVPASRVRCLERECVCLLLALSACIPPSPIASHTHITEYATHPALSSVCLSPLCIISASLPHLGPFSATYH